MKKTLIIGGGISGLSAALKCKYNFPNEHVQVIDSSSSFGGWIRSIEYNDGSIHEIGPRTIRLNSESSDSILKLINLTNSESNMISIPKNDVSFNKRYIYAHGKLHQLNLSLTKGATEPFTESFLVKLFKSSMHNYRDQRNVSDYTVDYFFRTRFGSEVADYLINPIIRGIYACDSKNLGIDATFPLILEYERSGPNAIIGYIKKTIMDAVFIPMNHEVEGITDSLKKQKDISSVISFNKGMSTIVDNLVQKLLELNVELHNEHLVTSVQFCDSFKVTTSNGLFTCDKLICALPSHIATSVLPGQLDVASLLNSIKWNSIIVVVLEFKGINIIKRKGFGHLIPSWEIPSVLGVVYDSCVLPQLDSKNGSSTRLTVMLGGAWSNSFTQHTSLDFQNIALDVVKTQLGITSELIRSTVVAQNKCVPEYGLRHRQMVKIIRQRISNSQLALCGNSYDGVSVSDCVASGFRAADSFL